MNASDASTIGFSSGEENFPLHFSEWLKRRRKELDLTQEQLAHCASCSVFAIRKIESGERRPSQQLARMLAQSLEIPLEDQAVFIKAARGELSMERLASLARISSHDSQQVINSNSISSNLPKALTPFIGREPELYSLGQLLCDPQCSLLTLVGPGGIGKTRLAIEAANQYKDRFPDGVWFVPLAVLNSPALLVPAIADGINLKIQDPTDPQTQLFQHLCGKRTLIILDNVEHLLDGIGLFAQILKACPQVKLLVTSRERLNLYGEWVFELLGLPMPASDQVEQFESYSSVSLFLQSARRALPGLMLDETDRAAVVDICCLLEGMPLAIELAATWVKVLSTAEIAVEIKHSLDFLCTSARDVPERHRSMRAVFDHSWKMLSVDEQQVLCRLSVFRGGFERQAAEQVAGASLSILSALAHRTLLRLSQSQLRGGTVRYDLHELIRQYCAAHLAEDPQAYAVAHERHCAFFLALAETANRELRGPHQLEWLNRLDQELGNLRAALEWSLKSNAFAQGMDEPALRLSGALRWFWQIRGYFHEGCVWLERALDRSRSELTEVPMPSLENTSHLRNLGAQACALEGLALLTNSLGDHGNAHTLAEQSAALYQKLGDKRGLAAALMILGQTHHWRGEVSLSHSRLGEALALYREAGDQWNIARSLYRLGTRLADFGGDVAGCAMLEESAAILEKLGDKYLFVNVLVAQGVISLASCNYSQARAHFERSLNIAREIRDPWEVADALTNIGCILRIQGDYGSANSYYEEAFRIYQEGGRGIWCADPLCALAENDIAQGHLEDAHLHLQDASTYAETSENKWVQTLIGYFQGLLMYYEGDLESSTKCLEEVIALARESQYKPDLARALVTLGRVRNVRGEKTKATMLLGEGISLFQKMNSRLGIAMALEGFAELVLPETPENAINFMKAAESIRDSIGAPLPPIDRPSYEREVATVRAQLGEEGFAEEWVKAEPWTTVVMELVTNFNP